MRQASSDNIIQEMAKQIPLNGPPVISRLAAIPSRSLKVPTLQSLLLSLWEAALQAPLILLAARSRPQFCPARPSFQLSRPALLLRLRRLHLPSAQLFPHLRLSSHLLQPLS